MAGIPKKCVVSSCVTNSRDYPTKIFLTIPKDKIRRNNWARALNVTKITGNARYAVCEDHFDLENDCTNWMFFKTIGKKLMLKNDVVPHRNLEVATTSKISQFTDSERKRKAESLQPFNDKRARTFEEGFPLTSAIDTFSSDFPCDLSEVGSSVRSVAIQVKPNVRTQGTDIANLTDVSVGTTTNKSSSSTSISFPSFSGDDVTTGYRIALENVRRQSSTDLTDTESQFYLALPNSVYFLSL